MIASSIPIYVTIVLCGGCTYLGYWIANIRRPGQIASKDPAGSHPDKPGTAHNKPSFEAINVQQILLSLGDLTSQVTSQVGQHSLRLNEASQMLVTSKDSTGVIVLEAASLLINANQQLQSELADARNEIEKQRQQIDSVVVESRTDVLTKLANRRAFDLDMIQQFGLYRRGQSIVSLLIIDVDHFKRFNDTHGHLMGDQVLQGVARCLTETLRECDFPSRFGGEEFAVLLPMTPLGGAVIAADRIRNVIANTTHKCGLQVTVSIGVAEISGDESPEDLITRADQALYSAKRAGRNACFYHDGLTCKPAAAGTDSGSLQHESAADSQQPPLAITANSRLLDSHLTQPA